MTPTDEAWTWVLSERAADAMASLDAVVQQRVLDRFDAVVDDEFRTPPEFTDPLTGMGSWRSLRIWDYRAIVRFDRDRRRMEVGTVGHRSDVYEDFP